MNEVNILTVFVTVVVIFVPIYMFYMSWFRSSKYLDDSRRGVPDWLPFSHSLRDVYGSTPWLWFSRILSIILLIIVLYFILSITSGPN